ncbi:MAG: TOMM precursor leader peptide-binding protein [Gimesia sp.]
MNILRDKYYWHPKFNVQGLDHEQLILLGETQQFLLTIPYLKFLFPQVDQEQLPYTATHTLFSLIEAGYLQQKGEKTEQGIYNLPDFSAAPTSSILSQIDLPDLQPWVASLEEIDSTAVIIVDDYLDPRLTEIARKFRDQQQPWLVVKATGQHLRVGPYISQKPGAACWQCFSHRILKNQPVREWLQRQNKGQTIPVPIFYHTQQTQDQLPELNRLARQLIGEKKTELFFEINLSAGSVTQHPVITRPQCQVCGEPQLFSQQVTDSIELQPSLKNFTRDGGVRTIPPAETNQNIKWLISPLSGVICDVSNREKSNLSVNKQYRSSFFKTSFQTDQLQNDVFIQTTMGKGISAEQSKASAMGESIERIAANYHGDEPIVWGTTQEIDQRYFTPDQLTPFSKKQYTQFDDPQHPYAKMLHSSAQYQEGQSLHWTPVQSLTRQESCYLPATFCYANTPFYREERYCRFFHNGGAAGNTLEEAILQAYLEVIERDAAAIWWYNCLVRPAVDLHNISEELQQLMEETIGKRWDFWVLDLTHDFEIPVFVAIGQLKKSKKFCLGFGCHPDASLASRRALTELLQLIEIRGQHSAPFDFNQIPAEPYLFPCPDTEPVNLDQATAPQNVDIKDDILHCIQQTKSLGLESLLLNYSRPDLVLKTAKVFIPGMCHIFPYFAATRLYQVPVSQKWLEQPLKEEELNPLHLLI